MNYKYLRLIQNLFHFLIFLSLFASSKIMAQNVLFQPSKYNKHINPQIALWKILYLKIKMTESKEVPQLMTEFDRRSGKDRRQFSYTAYIPERRCGKDRRIRKSRGRTYVLNIEDDGTMRAEEIRFKKY